MPAKKPNVVFFFTDDQRFDTIHALGNGEIQTPTMDRLVKNGTAFTHAHIPSGTVGAICMPSRAMLHSGRTLFHIQQEGQQIPTEHRTMGETFRQAGYRTFGTGKWHNGPASYGRSFTDGTAIFFGGMWDHWNVPLCHFDPSGKYENLIPFTHNFMRSNTTSKVHCDYFSAGKHSSELFSQAAIDFIEDYDADAPFFMYISYLAPHDPRTMPPRFQEMYDPNEITLPDNFMEQHPFNYGAEHIRDELLAPYPRTPEEVKRHIAEYYAMITHLDFEIGRVIEALEQTGQADNTIIVLAGDNGLAVGQHGLMGKQSHYEHSVRVPLIFSGVGVPKGERREQYAYLLDVYPTLCELTGVNIPDTVEGQSLYPSMADPDAALRETLYFAYSDLIRSVKDDRYKLIEYAGAVRETQLFDLHADPRECNNLYGQEAYEGLVSKLRGELIRYRDAWDDLLHPLGQSFWGKAGL
ncbi:sulfatase-like hydrolase/transferase [Paenibacillus cremeus]|nr:sulfatase-like hydrolase/transferase [Paenibacillus cremeus]